MNNKFEKVMKTALTVIGVAAVAKVVSDKLSEMHNKKLCDCIDKKFNNGKDIIIKSFDEEDLQCCDNKLQEQMDVNSPDNTSKINVESNVFKKAKEHTMIPDIRKYESSNNENHILKYPIKTNNNFASCCNEEILSEQYNEELEKNISKNKELENIVAEA
ncbi:hypothetical protein [Clostridium sp. UBA6640]|uniref:hypothetical protein n=1 Tax=Clostridium sp. UBA6640 TaxID=1946370 RepID=UPI0025BD1D0E|nr:hypothetical protein [Clostridium sp. UBA6640]